KLLMFVVVVLTQFRLANGARCGVPENLRQQSNFKRPIVWNSHAAHKVGIHGKFTRQRVTKRIEIHEKWMLSKNAAQSAQQWSDKQTHCAPVQFPTDSS